MKVEFRIRDIDEATRHPRARRRLVGMGRSCERLDCGIYRKGIKDDER
jgi:hypothetical protein